MDEQTLIARTGTLVEAGVDEEMFVLDVDGGNCFGFNATATEIWRMLETPMTLGAICDSLIQYRDIDRETCLAETATLLDALAKDELVLLTPV